MKTKLAKLKELRVQNNIKQEDMAALLEISKPAYCQKENGKRAFTVSECKIIADLFGETIERIFFDNGVNTNITV